MRQRRLVFTLLLALSMLMAACTSDVQETQAPLGTEPSGQVEVPTDVMQTEVAEPTLSEPAATPTEEIVQTEEPTGVAVETPTAEVAATPAVTDTAVMTDTAGIPATGLTGLVLADELLGLPVSTSDGQAVGEVADLVVNLIDSEIDYVVVQKTAEAEDAGDQEADYVPVPWRGFTFADAAWVDVSAEDFETATTFDLKATAFMIPSDWDEEFGAGWEELFPATEAVTGTVDQAPEAEEEEAEPVPGMDIVLLSSLADQQVMGADGGSLAQVTVLVVNAETGEVPFVLVSLAEGAGDAAGTTVGAPLAALSWDPAARTLSLSVDASALQGAPALNVEDFPTSGDTGIEDSVQEYWEGILPNQEPQS